MSGYRNSYLSVVAQLSSVLFKPVLVAKGTVYLARVSEAINWHVVTSYAIVLGQRYDKT